MRASRKTTKAVNPIPHENDRGNPLDQSMRSGRNPDGYTMAEAEAILRARQPTLKNDIESKLDISLAELGISV